MPRWEPGSRGRLAEAALELFRERGYEQTTVAEIARRAGVTERTFFRHYADKREVLFAGSETLRDLMVDAVVAAPAAAGALDAAGAGVDAIARFLEDGRAFSRRRQAVIAANPELQERELIKLAALAGRLAEVLRGRGVAEPGASLAAEAAMAAFRVAFERWVDGAERRDLATLTRASLDELRAVAAGA